MLPFASHSAQATLVYSLFLQSAKSSSTSCSTCMPSDRMLSAQKSLTLSRSLPKLHPHGSPSAAPLTLTMHQALILTYFSQHLSQPAIVQVYLLIVPVPSPLEYRLHAGRDLAHCSALHPRARDTAGNIIATQ